MKIVKVQYTAKADYAEKNRENISRVMDELRGLNTPGIKYSVFVNEDGRSFVHLAIFNTEEDQKIHSGLESFKNFTTELKANGLETLPKSEILSLAGSSYDFFNNNII